MNRLPPWLPGLSALVALLVAAPPGSAQVALGPGSPLVPPVGRVTVLEGARLRAEGLHTLADALRLVPGLGVLETGAYAGGTATLAADGGSGADVLVRWDGVPLGLGDGPVDLSHLTLDDVERIEVRRGVAADLAGGGASAAVVDVSTRARVRRRSAEAEASAGGDRTSLLRAEAAGGARLIAASAGASVLGTDGGVVAGERYGRPAAAVSLALGPWRSAWIRLSGRWSGARYDFPTGDAGLAPEAGAVYPGLDKVRRSDLRTLALQAGYALGNRVLLFGLFGRDARDDRFTWADFDSTNNVPHIELARSRSSRTHATAAASLRATRWLSARVAYEDDRGSVIAVDTVRNDADPSSPSWMVWSWSRLERAWHATAWRGEIEAKRGAFALGAALRRDAWRGWGTALTWRAMASWTARSGTEVHVGARTGYRAPGSIDILGSFTPLTADPSLTLQRSRTLEAGVSQPLLRGRLGVAATLLEQRFTDYVAAVPVAAGPVFSNWVLTNLGAARARGVELTVVALPVRRLEVDAALTHLPTRVLAAGLPVAGLEFIPGQALIGRPDDIATLGATLALRRGGVLDVRLRHVSRRAGLHYRFGQVRDTLPAYTTVDLGGTVRLLRPVAVQFRVENLFDARYDDGRDTALQLIGGYPAARRRVVAGARVDLP